MKRVAMIALATLAAASCSSTTHPASSKAASFTAGVCTAISTWGDEIVDAANAFTDVSPHLSIEGRRAQYLLAFDRQQHLTDGLRDELDAAPSNGVDDPDALRAALLQATADVADNIRDNKADAAAHVDFHFIGPKPDRLFAGTEKSLSLMLKPLDELARDRHVDALGGSCGR